MEPGPINEAKEAGPPLTDRGWAIVLALTAVGLDGLAFAAGTSAGGRGWAFAFPCLCLNGLAAPACAGVAACFALRRLGRRRGLDGVAWLALALAAAAAGAGLLMAEWSGEAVSAV